MANTQYYHYDPSLAAAVVFTILFALSTIFHLYQMVRTSTKFFIPFVIGGFLEILGFVARTINANETPDWSYGVFVIQSLGILLAPALFAASIYMCLARIILLLEGEALSLVKMKWLTKLFVGGDILSFIFQAVGGSIIAKSDPDTATLGKVIIEVGLGIQIVFFGFFVVNLATFWTRIRKFPTSRSTISPWKRHIQALVAASALILIRSVYRIIEYIEGPTGELMTHEIYIYVLDAGLMLIVMMIFHVVHPSEIGSLLYGGKVAKLFHIKANDDGFSMLPLRPRSGSVELISSREPLGRGRP